jgi:hypothetical protein
MLLEERGSTGHSLENTAYPISPSNKELYFSPVEALGHLFSKNLTQIWEIMG